MSGIEPDSNMNSSLEKSSEDWLKEKSLFWATLDINTNDFFPSYKLSWIQKDGDLVVNQQVKVNLFVRHHA